MPKFLSLGLFAAALLLAGAAQAQTLKLVGPAGARDLDAAALAAMPHLPAAMDDHGTKVAYEGVPLRALATLAGAPEGAAVRGQHLAATLLVTASDGYRVAFSLGEIEPTLGGVRAVLADRQDGKPLDAKQGPFRLVVEGDSRPARSARNVVSIEVRP
ncbi:MAG: molybdopterin-binding oxidoreductase [Caulobacteraceae bacterium]|nr:molybdopterin-binding oxidoreductase [Caulobacteraceae bacterium]